MNSKVRYTLMIAAVMLGSCSQTPKPSPYVAVEKPAHKFSVNGSVREMSIIPENPTLPDHEGKAEFVSYCSMCHSLKYITMQPDFPRKVWDAEVHKMVAKFNAPIDSAICLKIVDYLVAIKSKS